MLLLTKSFVWLSALVKTGYNVVIALPIVELTLLVA